MIAIVEYIYIMKKNGDAFLIRKIHKMKNKNPFTNTAFCCIITVVTIMLFMIGAEIGLTKSGW